MNACSLWDPQLACIDQGKCYCYHIELLSGFSLKSSVISNQAGTIPPITAYPTHNIFLPKPFWHVRKINCHFYFGVCIITTDYQNIQLYLYIFLWVENLKLNFIKKKQKSKRLCFILYKHILKRREIIQKSYSPLSSAATVAGKGSYVVNKRLSSNLIWGKGHSEYFW